MPGVLHRRLRGGEIRLNILDGLLPRLGREILRDILTQRRQTWAAELVPVGEAVNAAKTAMFCSWRANRRLVGLHAVLDASPPDRSARSTMRAPDAVGPGLPVYQDTVFAGVPLTSEVAAFNGEPETRSGGWIAVTVDGKPSAASAVAFELVTDKLAALSVCSVTTPPLTVDGVEVPVI